MDESKALHQLTEAADLINMLEAICNVGSADQIPPTSWAGFRITLRSVRESILGSHDTLARDLLQRAKHRMDLNAPEQSARQVASSGISRPAMSMAEAPSMKFERRDLKASLEKYVEKPSS